jgi:hypothetical protein
VLYALCSLLLVGAVKDVRPLVIWHGLGEKPTFAK